MRARLILPIVLLTLAGIVPAGQTGDAPRLEVELDRDSVRVGEPVTYRLRAAAPPDARVVFPEYPDGRIGDFEISSSREEIGKEGERVMILVLQGFETGGFTLPSPEVSVRNADGEEAILSGPALEIEVVSVLDPAEEAPDIRDLKDPVGLPRSYRWLFYLVPAVLAAAGGAWLLYRKFARPERREPPPPPPRPAHEIALEELERIREADLPGRGLVKEYYSRVSDAVRRYLENRFGLRAPERTTEEFLQEMATTSHLSGDQQNLVTAFLAEADLVKFARYGPTEKEMAGVFAAAVRLVEETREDASHRQECLCYSPGPPAREDRAGREGEA